MGVSKQPSNSAKQGISRIFARPTMGAAISLLVAVQAFAIGMKAIDDRKSDNAAILQNAKFEVIALSEHIHGRALEVRGLLAFADRDDTRALAGKADIVVPYSEAIMAQTGSRLKRAADIAGTLNRSDKWLGLSEHNDLIILSETADNTLMLSLVDARTWLNAAPGTQLIKLSAPEFSGDLTVGTLSSPFTDTQIEDQRRETEGFYGRRAFYRGLYHASRCIPVSLQHKRASSVFRRRLATLDWVPAFIDRTSTRTLGPLQPFHKSPRWSRRGTRGRAHGKTPA